MLTSPQYQVYAQAGLNAHDVCYLKAICFYTSPQYQVYAQVGLNAHDVCYLKAMFLH